MRSALAAAALLVLLAGAAGCGDERSSASGGTEGSPTASTPAPASRVSGPTIAAAGDIACVPGMRPTRSRCRHAATANVIERLDPDVVAPLGDLQYDRGELSNFRRSYGPTWGRFRARTRPAVGNHEWVRNSAADYFTYFGARAGRRGRGWYSYDLGDWHVVVLNSNCSRVGCARGSAQERWLRADLAANPARCTLAYWHHARFSSGLHGNDGTVAPLWRALQDAGADVVLSGHDHSYERFAPQTSTGRGTRDGIVQFVVGTGGVNNYPILRARPNSRVRRSFVFGVLQLTLGDGAYGWRFVPAPGLTFSDRGTARCV